MRTTRENGLSIVEILVAIAIVITLIWLAFPFIEGAHARPPMHRILSNMVQLRIATEQLATDNTQTSAVGWPGDMNGSFSNWAHHLVAGNYLTATDLRKLLSAPGRTINPEETPTASASAILVYSVRADSPGSTVFFSSANFTNTSTGGVRPPASAIRHGEKSFVLLRRNGEGAILRESQAGDTILIGGYVPLCR